MSASSSRRPFYAITFESKVSGQTEVSRTFATIRVARKWADFYRGFAGNVRIMQGGPGGMEVK